MMKLDIIDPNLTPFITYNWINLSTRETRVQVFDDAF